MSVKCQMLMLYLVHTHTHTETDIPDEKVYCHLELASIHRLSSQGARGAYTSF